MKDAGAGHWSISAIAIVNAAGAVMTAAFWALVYFRVFAPGAPPAAQDAGAMSATFGFMAGDLTWALALQALSAAGLWRMRTWGWLAAQMVNILWLYSMTVIWCRDAHAGALSPGAVLFLPFVPFSLWALRRLWVVRRDFGIGRGAFPESGPR